MSVPGTREKCPIGICGEHPHTVERLATVEKGMTGVEDTMRQVIKRLDLMRDTTMNEFQTMRENVTSGIMKRHSNGTVLAFSALTGAVCGLAVALLSK